MKQNTFFPYTAKTQNEILREFKVSAEAGLSPTEVLKRRQYNGFNEIAAHETTGWEILLRQFKSPFMYLLVAAVILSFIFKENIDGFMILIFITVNSSLGFYQEYHSVRTIKLLKKYIVSHAHVVREGVETLIPSREIVPGDILILRPGDIINADIRFLTTENLIVNESVLTGESSPVTKTADTLDTPVKEVYQAKNIGFFATSVVSGEGRGVVLTSGKNTNIGDIVQLTAETSHVSSFEKGISKFSRFILQLIIITLVFVVIANLIIRGGRTSTIELIIFAIALAVSVIPEALPVVTTFSLSRGAFELAKNKVVVKRLSAIEDLGSIDILCTDKTGTLTENKLSVANVFSKDYETTLLFGSLTAESSGKDNPEIIDSFDLALFKALSDEDGTKRKDYQKIDEIPFDAQRRIDSVLVKNTQAGRPEKYHLITKGAPEEVLKRCKPLPATYRDSFERWMQEEGRRGCRVIAVAQKEIKFQHGRRTDLSDEESDLNLLGAISFTDPIKKTTIEAIHKAKLLGVGIKILTGDRPEVAGAVAQEIGLISSGTEVITGETFDALSESGKRAAIENFSVFARVSPQQKYQIIEMLQVKHEVGFLGEGINDAPALKIANVAMVVHEGVDIAREAADIILLNRSLKVIIDGIKDGRTVFANTIKYIKSTLSSNFGNFYAIAFVSLIVDFLPMTSLQILFINLLSDFPMIAVATDTVDPQELKKPKGYNIKDILLLAIILGLVSTAFDFIFFGLFKNGSPSYLQTYWLMGSILTELVLIFSIRTRMPFYRAKRPSKSLLYLSICAAAATVIIPFTAFGQKVFSFVTPTFGNILIIFGLVIIYFFITEGIKLFYYRMSDHQENLS